MRRIWRAVVTMGLSSALTLVLSVVRAKLVAVELGPGGVGVLGIITTSVMLAATALGGGLSSSGVRAVAAELEADRQRLDRVGRALARGSTLLAAVAVLLVTVAWAAFGDLLVPEGNSPSLAPWVALSVGATIAAAGNLALLNGLGRITSMAVSNGVGALVGTSLMVAAIQSSAYWGLVAAFAASPVATWMISALAVRSAFSWSARPPRRGWLPELRGMLALGVAVSGSVILTNATQVVARVWVGNQLGIASAGYLQGAFAVGAVYLGFLLNALSAEYFPRISAMRDQRELSNKSVNDQIVVMLALGVPVILWMIVIAPFLLQLLYTEEFKVADTLLRLLLVGDVFKLVGWCAGFLFLARDARRRFLTAELSWNLFFLAVLIPGVRLGLEFAGVAYLVAYLLYAIVALVLLARESGFVLSRQARGTVLLASLVTGATFLASEWGSDAGLVITLLLTTGYTGVAARDLYAWSRHGR